MPSASLGILVVGVPNVREKKTSPPLWRPRPLSRGAALPGDRGRLLLLIWEKVFFFHFLAMNFITQIL